MKLFENNELFNKWIRLILSIYYNNEKYESFRIIDKKITESKALNHLKSEILFLKKRRINLRYINLNKIENLLL